MLVRQYIRILYLYGQNTLPKASNHPETSVKYLNKLKEVVIIYFKFIELGLHCIFCPFKAYITKAIMLICMLFVSDMNFLSCFGIPSAFKIILC